jgi:hypothetical protein
MGSDTIFSHPIAVKPPCPQSRRGRRSHSSKTNIVSDPIFAHFRFPFSISIFDFHFRFPFSISIFDFRIFGAFPARLLMAGFSCLACCLAVSGRTRFFDAGYDRVVPVTHMDQAV